MVLKRRNIAFLGRISCYSELSVDYAQQSFQRACCKPDKKIYRPRCFCDCTFGKRFIFFFPITDNVSPPSLLPSFLTGEKPFSCPHCNRAFADRSNLRAHLQTHSDVKKYQCKNCSKTFSRMSLLHKHEESGCCVAH